MKNSKPEILLNNYLEKHNLKDSNIAIACSAGIDSISLVFAACTLLKPEQIYCLHYDHAVRSDSAIAAEHLAKLSKELGINYYSERNPEPGSSDEDSLRDLRYQFFENAAQKLNIQNILVAHNLNDNAETILFRLFRGTNTSGLTGIPSQRNLRGTVTIHRPWLELSRAEIEEYASELEHIEDTSNANDNYARNHIRLNIIPQALKLNSRAVENISKLAALISEQNEYIEYELAKYENRFGANDPELNWDLEAFRKLAALMQRKLLEKYFTTNISFCNDFMAAIAKGGFNRINFENGRYFCIRQKRIRLEQD